MMNSAGLSATGSAADAGRVPAPLPAMTSSMPAVVDSTSGATATSAARTVKSGGHDLVQEQHASNRR